MVKHTELVPQPKTVAMTCDRCGTRHDDVMETQEFLSWWNSCGYANTTYGDLSHIQIDLCQYCVREVLGPWIRHRKQWVMTNDELITTLEEVKYGDDGSS